MKDKDGYDLVFLQGAEEIKKRVVQGSVLIITGSLNAFEELNMEPIGFLCVPPGEKP